jgi:predicted amidophosphoribosyltransferase
MNCFKCGLELTGKGKFCSDCGAQQPTIEPTLAADPLAADLPETVAPASPAGHRNVTVHYLPPRCRHP